MSRLLSSALSIAFRNNNEDVSKIFSSARQFINFHIESCWKVRLFLTSAATSLFIILSLILVSMFSGIEPVFIYCAIAGILGSVVSSLQRNGDMKIDPYASGISLYADVISKLILGIIFGIFVIFISKSEIALSPFKNNIYALFCFSFIAGFSERFIPDLITTITKKTELKND